jgi:hypothetical protein
VYELLAAASRPTISRFLTGSTRCSIEPCPIFIHTDDLLLLLTKSGFGCYIGANFVGPLAHADDIVLVTSTTIALRQM